MRSLSPGLRDDLERAGMKFLVLVPVWGKAAQVGVLAFGLTGGARSPRSSFAF